MEGVLTEEATAFVAELERRFGPRRRELLAARAERQQRLAAGELPDFLPETREIREGDWTIEPVPADLRDRRVEITGPTDRKMVINALNSGARMFMADFEDANSPDLANMVEGQANLTDAIERTIELETRGKALPAERRDRDAARAAPRLAPRGAPSRASTASRSRRACSTSASTSSTTGSGCSTAARARTSTCRSSRATSRRGSGTTSSSHAEDALGLARGSIRATVLIETILAAFEMDEILWELREHSAGLNAGRWDYMFSVIKKLPRPARVRPARPQRGDDDRAVHARLHRAARQDLPPARRPRDGRDGGVHPEPHATPS